VRFRVLGPLEVQDRDGEPVRLGSPKLAALAICERTLDRRGSADCLRLLSETLEEVAPRGNGQRRSANE
jgi:hypothetical protein